MSFPIQTSMKEVLRKIVTAIILINLVVSTTAFAQSPTPLVLNNLEQAIAKAVSYTHLTLPTKA